MNQSHNIDDTYKVISIFNDGKYKKIKRLCDKHGEFIQYFQNYKRGHICKRCSSENVNLSKKFTIDQVDTWVRENTPYKLVSSVYENVDAKMEILCNTHGPFQTSFYIVKNMGCKCPKCSLESTVKKRRLSNEYILDVISRTPHKVSDISNYKNNTSKIELKCIKHGNFKTTISTIKKSKNGCTLCSRERNIKKQKLSLRDVESWIKNNTEYKLLSSSYLRSAYKLDVSCPKHGPFKISLNALKSNKRCRKCRKMESKSEKECRDIFEYIFNSSFKTIRPDFLKNPETGLNLELDGFSEKLNIAFEYDGEQHFHESGYTRENAATRLKKIQYRDNLKNKLCKFNNIKLIRIPYFIDNKEVFIYNELYRHNIIYTLRRNKAVSLNSETHGESNEEK
jgi:hypothetical protein